MSCFWLHSLDCIVSEFIIFNDLVLMSLEKSTQAHQHHLILDIGRCDIYKSSIGLLVFLVLTCLALNASIRVVDYIHRPMSDCSILLCIADGLEINTIFFKAWMQ